MEIDFKELLSLKFNIDGTFDAANSALNLDGDSVLDIGLGNGGASLLFALNGRQVTSIGLDLESYRYPKSLLKKLNVDIRNISFEDFFSEESFDIIWASHVLEHTLNVGYFLEKCRSLLNENGWLCVLVPPHKHKVVGGHVSNGWNLGQLMYVLLLSGFDIKTGHFIKIDYSLCAFVQKSKIPLPDLRMDRGDIEATADFWPIDVYQGFNGNIKSVNWFKKFNRYELHKTRILNLEEDKKELSSKVSCLQEENTQLKKSLEKFIQNKKG